MKAFKQIMIVVLLSIVIMFIWSGFDYYFSKEPVSAFSSLSEVKTTNPSNSDSSVESLLDAFKNDLQTSYPDLWTLDYEAPTGKMYVRILVSSDDYELFRSQVIEEDDFSSWYSLLGPVQDLIIDWQQRISSSGHKEITPLVTLYLPKAADTNQVLANFVGSKVVYDYFDTLVSSSSDASPSSFTLGQQNALKTAKSYLSVSAFSWKGLVEQLEFEGYTHDESIFAANNCGADWNEQAAKKASSYLRVSSFSRSGLIEQLEFEGFTHDQAVYGAVQVGY